LARAAMTGFRGYRKTPVAQRAAHVAGVVHHTGQHATQRATCNIQHATYNMHNATCRMQPAAGNIQHAKDETRDATYNIQDATYKLLVAADERLERARQHDCDGPVPRRTAALHSKCDPARCKVD
jgi:hypothetical protein